MDKKPFVFYCDDKEQWIKKFKSRHRKQFEIKSITKGLDFKQSLEKLLEQGREPDVILIDLFHPKYGDDDDPAEKEKAEREGNAAIDELEAAVKKAREYIYKAWDPYGLDMLEQARDLCPDIPIVVYTQQGLALVNENELGRASDAKGEWLLKGRDAHYESITINKILEKNKARAENKNGPEKSGAQKARRKITAVYDPEAGSPENDG